MPFSRYERMIAWRYIRTRKTEGGVTTLTWISFIGITLAVAAMIITLAVRSGFRAEFVDTILGANPHVTLYQAAGYDDAGRITYSVENYKPLAEQIKKISGVVHAAPLIKGQVLANFGGRNSGAEVFGIAASDLAFIPRIVNEDTSLGNFENFSSGLAIGSQLARELGVTLGDTIKLISPNGLRTAFGVSPRVNAYKVTYIFSAGRWDIDRTRIYLPFSEAQKYFNRDGRADMIEVIVREPESIDSYQNPLLAAGGPNALLFTWKDAAGGFLQALDIEDRVMFIILSVLVLLSSMNIISGLIMLVKNKQRDIGILRTIGVTQASVLRIFFLCGASIGIAGTLFGVFLGCLFAIYIDPIYTVINSLSEGNLWDPSIRIIYKLPAQLHFEDVMKTVALSLSLSFLVTFIPARRAARMAPVEALRYE